MADIVVLVLIVGYCAFFLLRRFMKAKNASGYGCSGGCAGCCGCKKALYSEIFKEKRS